MHLFRISQSLVALSLLMLVFLEINENFVDSCGGGGGKGGGKGFKKGKGGGWGGKKKEKKMKFKVKSWGGGGGKVKSNGPMVGSSLGTSTGGFSTREAVFGLFRGASQYLADKHEKHQQTRALRNQVTRSSPGVQLWCLINNFVLMLNNHRLSVTLRCPSTCLSTMIAAFRRVPLQI